MEFPFRNEVAVITGGAGGIGLAFAHRFAREGMRLVISDIDANELATAETALRTEGAEVIAIAADVSDPAQIGRLADAAFDAFGTVAILCNNAGIVPSGRSRHVWEYAIEDWRWALDVNLLGVVNGIRSFVPRMIASGKPGHIVNTASMAGLVSGPRSVVYSTSKHGVARVSEALYASLKDEGDRIGVTVLCPGLVDTRIYRSERNRPAGLVPAEGVAKERSDLEDTAANGLAPDTVADIVAQAIIDRQFYVLTTTGYDDAIRARSDALLARTNPQFVDVFAVKE